MRKRRGWASVILIRRWMRAVSYCTPTFGPVTWLVVLTVWFDSEIETELTTHERQLFFDYCTAAQ